MGSDKFRLQFEELAGLPQSLWVVALIPTIVSTGCGAAKAGRAIAAADRARNRFGLAIEFRH